MQRITHIVAGAVIITFSLWVVTTHAQNWQGPQANPPQNNPNQPPDTSGLENYVFRSVSTLQRVEGPVSAGQFTAFPDSWLGFHDAVAGTASVIAGSLISIDVSYINGNTGIYAFGKGLAYGLVGYSDSTSGTSYGIVGKTDAGLAARFYGPVEVLANPVSSDPGNLKVTGSVTADQGLECKWSNGCSFIASSWLTATNTNQKQGVYGHSNDRTGIFLTVGDGVDEESAALEGISTADAGVVGTGRTGMYGLARGTVAATYIGAAGIHASETTGSFQRKGVYGLSDSGLGSANYGTATNPKYDLAAGIRACVKNTSGTIVNQNGVVGEGIQYSGYFDGEGTGTGAGNVMIASVCSHNSFQRCTIDSDCGTGNTCEGKLQIGSVYLTKRNLKGLICRANNISVSTCHAVVCGDGIQGPGEQCDDGNTQNGDGCSATCRIE